MGSVRQRRRVYPVSTPTSHSRCVGRSDGRGCLSNYGRYGIGRSRSDAGMRSTTFVPASHGRDVHSGLRPSRAARGASSATGASCVRRHATSSLRFSALVDSRVVRVLSVKVQRLGRFRLPQFGFRSADARSAFHDRSLRMRPVLSLRSATRLVAQARASTPGPRRPTPFLSGAAADGRRDFVDARRGLGRARPARRSRARPASRPRSTSAASSCTASTRTTAARSPRASAPTTPAETRPMTVDG